MIVTDLGQWLSVQTEKRASLPETEPLHGQTSGSKLIRAKERNGPPNANQGFSTAKPRGSHAGYTLWVHPPTSPCPALSAGAEPKPQGHRRK